MKCLFLLLSCVVMSQEDELELPVSGNVEESIILEDGPSLIRVKRQFQTSVTSKLPDLSGIEQGCKTTGYETREREICEEIEERICLVSFKSSKSKNREKYIIQDFQQTLEDLRFLPRGLCLLTIRI